MPAPVDYRTDHAADPELYGRLMRERYGPLSRVLAERRHRPTTPEKPRMHTPPAPDPNAARHRADLEAALDTAAAGRPRPIRTSPPALAAQPLRPAAPAPVAAVTPVLTPPFPGSVWCNSCDSWCTPTGVCRCNDR